MPFAATEWNNLQFCLGAIATQVYVSIPFKRCAEIEAQTPCSSVLNKTDDRIMIIGNQTLSYHSICIQLQHLGWETKSTNDPEDAIHLIGQWQPDIVLLDLRMPVLSGFEVFAQILELDSRPVVLAMSGDATVETKQQCNEMGFDDFLVKPFRMTEFEKTISKFRKTDVKAN